MVFESFAVVRVPFPFTDRTAQKRRPALVVSRPDFQATSGHLVLAMVTSARQSAWPHDWLIQDLQAAGLTVPCLVRMKLFSLDERLVLGDLGLLAGVDQAGVRTALDQLLSR